MDIFNRTPAISEDTLHYTLYPTSELSSKEFSTTLAVSINSYVEESLLEFIWHRDPFELKVVPDPNSNGYMLEGRMRVGDCVDDEWLVVWLMMGISSKWDLTISILDSDGEFLLIEAADTLPAWVTPKNSENRVWIYSSRLHLIPISYVSPTSRRHHRQKPTVIGGEDVEDVRDEFISVEDAIRLVRDTSIDTLAPENVEKTVLRRISGYPSATRNHLQITKAYIPLDIARALSANPSLVQKAIETFYTRDAIQLRSAHRMSRFAPDTSVLRNVRMTRTAYAQLLGQNFFPPKAFGRWPEAEDSRSKKWRSIGMKIAVGFEMLYQESKKRTDSSITFEVMASAAQAKKDALRRNPEYLKFIQHLISLDYFHGEVEGSGMWNNLENKAAMSFLQVWQDDDATRPSFATLVNMAISDCPTLPKSATPDDEDSDDWLNINPNDFDSMLEKSIGSQNYGDTVIDNTAPSFEDEVASKQASRLKDLASKVEDFVEGQGDLDGAKFEDDYSSDEDVASEDTSSDESEKDDLVNKQAAMDKLVPSLNPADYGKMPASFYSNSQRTVPEDMVGGPDNSSDSGTQRQTYRKPIIPRDRYDGVDSDDETGSEDDIDGESDDDRPQVVGDVEVDMEQEEEEFLEFSRQELGITDSQWQSIIKDRKDRGAFVPTSATRQQIPSTNAMPPSSSIEPSSSNAQGRLSTPGPRPNVNPKLDSLEAVMTAMDEELARLRAAKVEDAKILAESGNGKSNQGKGKAPQVEEDEVEEDVEAAMDSELRAILERGDAGEEDLENEPMDYTLIKNFLESFKSQAGQSGPVGNLAGRLQPGWKLPRDES
ncbi:SGT1 protein-domain-containing protein [Infundibulicybe gibba]|nr:SGT1 protein-domain-containing protein [Infundibulicybe gibba]